MTLAPVPPDLEPSEQELAKALEGLSHFDAVIRNRMARLVWRVAKKEDDPNAFLVPFATEVSDYKDYLDSALWKRIRRRVLKAANHVCACCPDKATQVHHRDYRPRVLNGDDDTMLVALCRTCHEAIHTGWDGRSRNCWNDTEADLLRRVTAKATAPAT